MIGVVREKGTYKGTGSGGGGARVAPPATRAALDRHAVTLDTVCVNGVKEPGFRNDHHGIV